MPHNPHLNHLIKYAPISPPQPSNQHIMACTCKSTFGYTTPHQYVETNGHNQGLLVSGDGPVLIFHPQQEVFHWALLGEHFCVNFSGMKTITILGIRKPNFYR